MNAAHVVKTLEKFIRANSPVILTAFGVSGTLSTAYLASKASFKAAEELRVANIVSDNPLTKKEKVKKVWPLYIPTGISAGLTIGAIISGTRLGMKKTAAAYSLLTVSEKAFEEYKEKVVDQIGKNKEQAIRDEIAQDGVTKDSPGVVVVGTGSVLCKELHTGRYFNSDMETLRRAENRVNAKMIREIDATLSDFYWMVGLPVTSYSSSTGWDSDKLMVLEFSTTITDDGRPCLAFDYNYVRPF